MKRLLAGYDQDWYSAVSGALCDKLTVLLRSFPVNQRQYLLAWVPFFKGEPDLLDWLEAEVGRKRIFFPAFSSVGEMLFREVNCGQWPPALVKGLRGIPEPFADRQAFDTSCAPSALVLSPGLAFDRKGGRLGRGGGCYDRFLGQAGMLNSLKVGVCWSFQILDELPLEGHDVRMDWIRTENEFFRSRPITATEDTLKP